MELWVCMVKVFKYMLLYRRIMVSYWMWLIGICGWLGFFEVLVYYFILNDDFNLYVFIGLYLVLGGLNSSFDKR